MSMEKEREIIKLWNLLRALQKRGQPTTAALRAIEKALEEREAA